jgi:hypothetical protein
MNNSLNILSDITVFNKYARYLPVLERRAELAKSRLETRAPGSPLRYGVACRVIIEGAK